MRSTDITTRRAFISPPSRCAFRYVSEIRSSNSHSTISSGFIGEAIGIDDVIGGAIILVACLSNEFNLYDRFIGKSESKNV